MNGPASNAGAVAATLAHHHQHDQVQHAPEQPPDLVVLLYGGIFLLLFCAFSFAYKFWESRNEQGED